MRMRGIPLSSRLVPYRITPIPQKPWPANQLPLLLGYCQWLGYTNCILMVTRKTPLKTYIHGIKMTCSGYYTYVVCTEECFIIDWDMTCNTCLISAIHMGARPK